MSRLQFISKAILILLLLLFAFACADSNCWGASEHLKIQKIALFNPEPSRIANQKTINFVNLYFQKYAEARRQVALVPFNPNQRTIDLQEQKNRGFQLAVIPNIKGKKAKLEVYELNQNRKLWVLSNELDSDMELLFWILDRSLIAGIKMAPNQIGLGLVPGVNGDLPGNFPCRDICHNLKQLSNVKIKAVPLQTYNSYQGHLGELSSNLRLDYFLLYKSNELDMTKPLVTGGILKSDGSSYTDIALRIETSKIGSVVVASSDHTQDRQSSHSGFNPSTGNIDPGPITHTEPALYNFVQTNYLVSVASELSHYFLAVLLTDFCHPEKHPLKLKLTKLRKYIRGESSPIPPLDNTLTENLFRLKLN